MSRKLFVLAMAVMLMMVCGAFAAMKVELEAGEGKVNYAFSLDDAQFAILEYTASDTGGKMVVYGENGVFGGEILLPWSGKGGNVELTVKNIKNSTIGTASVKLEKSAGYAVPEGKSNAKVEDLVLTETVDGFDYSFRAEGTDFMLLQFRNKQESGACYVFPNENGVYEGEIALPITYARTLTTVKICTGKEVVKKEATVRKAYQIGEAPEQTEGRLSGLVVCVDSGHQENGQMVREPIGPGLE